ncbi:MAG TPA: FAD-dependent oxidoreductase [Trebonia sp.]|nr:FAD-dependent oxidoreductase [Trebonia sp.]
MADQLTAVVVGGGIAGLASAVALAQAGWRVTVLERAPAFGEVGAGLAVTGNGMTALAALGLDEAVRAVGYHSAVAGYQDQGGRWLMRLPAAEVTSIWGLHRQRLHGVLLAAAQTGESVEHVTDAEVTAVRPGAPGGEQAEVTFKTTTMLADLVVAADGVRSAVRAVLFPAVKPRYGGSTSWRAVISSVAEGRLIQAWGPGTEFGALRVSDSELYWYGYFRSPANQVFPDELAAARAKFAGWAPWIRELVNATTADQLMRHDVYHLPQGPSSYVSGRVVLVGDAAHAALPTSGQGAASALEDGVCVGRMIAAPVKAGGDLAQQLTAFDRARRPRCQRIVRTGIMVARFGADLGGGWRQTVRNAVLRITPPGPLIKIGAPIVRWTPP